MKIHCYLFSHQRKGIDFKKRKYREKLTFRRVSCVREDQFWCSVNCYPEYQRSSFQRKYLDLWRPSVEILSRTCLSNSCRKNQRWRANLTILMSIRLYQYTFLLLMNSLETSKCNWNEFRPKEIFYMTPECIIIITRLSIMVMLRQWNRDNRKTFMAAFRPRVGLH